MEFYTFSVEIEYQDLPIPIICMRRTHSQKDKGENKGEKEGERNPGEISTATNSIEYWWLEFQQLILVEESVKTQCEIFALKLQLF